MNEWTGLSDAEVETIYAAYDTVAGSEAKSTEGKRRIVEPIYRAVIRARVQTAQMNALRDQVDPRSDEDIEEDALDNAYRERNAVVAALIRVGGYRAWRMLAPDAEGWWIVYAETPMGQVSWHVAPVDIRLFDGVPVGSDPWDGHSTAEKYDRVARLVPAASSAAAASQGDEGLREALVAYFGAVDDITDAGEARGGDPALIVAMYRDADKRKAEAERTLREYAAAKPEGKRP